MPETKHDRSDRIHSLSPDKLALLMKRLSQKREPASMSVIPRRERQSFCVPSFAQQRLWFVQQLEPNLVSYNYHAARRILGHLERRALEATLIALAERHESLRTTFAVESGELLQVISPHLDLSVPLIDLAALDEERKMAEAGRLGEAEQELPFDLERGPLLRGVLLRLAEGDFVVLLTLHHIVSDAWSVAILVRELGALYPTVAAGLPSPLPPLPIQYADFAEWERKALAGPAIEERLAWWTRQLDNAPTALRVPVDRPRHAARSHRAGYHELLVPKDLLSDLIALTRQEDATLFVTALAAFAVLLGWWSGDEDVVIGSPIANRNLAEVEGLIGFFINILALRIRLKGDPSVVDLLRQARATSYGAFDRRDLPFDKVIEVLRPARDADRTPVFQVTLTLQNSPTSVLTIPGLVIREFEAGAATVKYDLMLDLWETPAGLDTCFTYDTDLFFPATVERLAQLYEVLLREIAARPQARLSELREVLTRTDQEVRRGQERAFKQSRSEKLRAIRRKESTA